MATLRIVITEALYAIKGLAPGDDMTIDEINVALPQALTLILELHEARGPLRDIDINADYTAGENERVRIEDQSSATVTLPNAVSIMNGQPCNDYGFIASTDAPTGVAGPADGQTYRAPRDGVRVEVVGTSQALFFYRADVNLWVRGDGLAIDDLLPFSERYKGHFVALLAFRLGDIWPNDFNPSPTLKMRYAKANSAFLVRSGVARSPVQGQYF